MSLHSGFVINFDEVADMLFTLFLINILVWIFSERDLFQVTGTDTSCVLYMICS